jgi:capsular exopolysaccharide synthesis family protein
MDRSRTDLRDYLRVLRKYRLTILAFVVATLLAVALVSLRLPKRYEAVARIALDRESPTTLVQDTMAVDRWGFQDYLRTQIRVLESETLAAQTIRALDWGREPALAERENARAVAGALALESGLGDQRESQLIRQFLDNLRVIAVPNTWLVEVRFYSTDPEQAARVANAHAHNFIEHNFRTKYEATRKASDWLGEQLRELRARVERADEQLHEFERRTNLLSTGEKQNIHTQRLADLNRELAVAEADRVARESRHRQAAASQGTGFLQDELLTTLSERLTALRARRAEGRTQLGPQHPRMRRLQEQIAEVEAQVRAQQQAIRNRLQADYEAALKREELVRQLVEQQKTDVNQLNQRLIQYNILKREAAAQKQLYDSLLQRLEEAGITSGLRSSNIRVVDPARVPLEPYSPRLGLNVLLALCVSLPLGIALAFLRDHLDNTVKTPDEVERYGALATLAVVPLADPLSRNHSVRALSSAAEKSGVALVTHDQPQSPLAEAFRSLRTWVMLSVPERPPRVLLVTSGQPVEGKTSTAVNLSIALAQRGDKVALVDADLRKPSIHDFLPSNGSGGLSAYLAGAQGADGLVATTSVPNLCVLPAGPVPPNPAELLSAERMRELLLRLGREYDYVVVDSPPLLSVTDATVLSVLVDGVILVVRSGTTTREGLRHSRQLLLNANARVLGAVLNAVDLRSPDYYYYCSKVYGYRDPHASAAR